MQQQAAMGIAPTPAQQALLVQQMMMMSAPGMLPSAGLAAAAPVATASAPSSDRKQREVYIGNLAIGVTTEEILLEFFNKARARLGSMRPAASGPPLPLQLRPAPVPSRPPPPLPAGRPFPEPPGFGLHGH